MKKAKCTKVQFTKKDAQTYLNAAKRSKNKYRKECRIYPCPVCNAWHLTSKE